MSQEKIEQLLDVLEGTEQLLILPHNNPDSDAIASAYALRGLIETRLGLRGDILYKGLIGRAENKALARYLGHPLRLLQKADLQPEATLILVDTQPSRSNNPVPATYPITAVIDHHTWYETNGPITAPFADVRTDLGATSTILTEYIQAAGIELSTELATALFYGIKTSTMGLGRNTSAADAEAYYYLQPHIDVEAVASIETARVPPNYFKSFDIALRAAQIYDGVVISYIGPMSYPDLAAEMADLLLRLEESKWVLCMGVYNDTFILSVRTRRQRDRAGQFVRMIIGPTGTAGGHGTMAGGQIPLDGRPPAQIAAELSAQALRHLDLPPDFSSRPLIVNGE